MSQKPVIAIIDDDQSIREALDDLVLSCGYSSRVYASAEAFLAEGDQQAVDCILVDVKMPGLSGIELQAVLNGTGRKPPMIFMTSYRDEKTKAAAMDGGAFAFLGKPVDFANLIACMERALNPRHGGGQ